MKYPCVELYFEMELGPLDVRLWLKTNNELKDGALPLSDYMTMDRVKSEIQSRNIQDKERIVRYLTGVEALSAFQVSYRHDLNRTAIVVYREWP